MTRASHAAGGTAGWDIALDADYHVHSDFSDDAVSTVSQNVRAARDRGLRTLCLADHVRRDTDWAPAFAAAVRPLRDLPGIEILAGVEAKILDSAGRLDLPGGLDGIDRVLIADHQFPGPGGPASPETVRAALDAGETTPDEVISCLAEATARALRQVPAGLVPQIAHLFSLLPKIGLAGAPIPARLLGDLADQARASGAPVEVNEKWRCPPPQVLRAMHSAGVELIPSTDSHDCTDIGRYRAVRDLLGQAAGARAC